MVNNTENHRNDEKKSENRPTHKYIYCSTCGEPTNRPAQNGECLRCYYTVTPSPAVPQSPAQKLAEKAHVVATMIKEARKERKVPTAEIEKMVTMAAEDGGFEYVALLKLVQANLRRRS